MTYLPTPVEQASATTTLDPLHPYPGTRQDSGEPIWFVPSGDHVGQYFLLMLQGNRVCCSCQEQHTRCPHASAVFLARQPQPAIPAPSSRMLPSPSTLHPHPTLRTEQERRQVEAADRRDQAMLWTDDRPFSIWKE